MAHAIFFRSAAILKVLVRPNWFSNLSEPWVKESRHANFGAIQAIFLQLSWSQHKLAHSCQGRGQRSNGAINRNIHLFRSFCRGISNLVTPSLTVAERDFFKVPKVRLRGHWHVCLIDCLYSCTYILTFAFWLVQADHIMNNRNGKNHQSLLSFNLFFSNRNQALNTPARLGSSTTCDVLVSPSNMGSRNR